MTARIAALLLWTSISDSTVECSIEGVSLIQSERRGVAAIHRWSQWMVKTHGGDRDGGPLLVRRERNDARHRAPDGAVLRQPVRHLDRTDHACAMCSCISASSTHFSIEPAGI